MNARPDLHPMFSRLLHMSSVDKLCRGDSRVVDEGGVLGTSLETEFREERLPRGSVERPSLDGKTFSDDLREGSPGMCHVSGGRDPRGVASRGFGAISLLRIAASPRWTERDETGEKNR